MVIDAVTITPPLMSILTCEVVVPLTISVTLPFRILRALIFMRLSLSSAVSDLS
ncbi:hypothetical protein [Mesorhizobium sp.]|uniref:hypothetical protein n=1 Tax=Mesorhizobium sp. TaxID=1871066 RepID=UPI0025C1307F|nr:hypothetical protein [Mesorhizobium sp.]